MAVEIETPRLLLRRWEEADLGPFIRMNADPEVMRYFPEPYSEERTRQLYSLIQEEFAACGFGLYAVEEKGGGAFMGLTGFHRATLDTDFCPCIEIGWRLDKPYWGKGYATEGAAACLEHGFSRLGIEEVFSFTATANLPSQNVMRKIGMRFHEYFDHPEVPEGNPLKPHVCYIAYKPT